jgi:CHAD domain-containing protein
MYKLEPKNYFETLNSIIQKINDRLEKYLQNPNEENVHNARTAIRKLEPAWKILPKKIRQKRKVEKFVLSCKKFFKTNNDIRDFDIMHQRLVSLPVPTTEIIKLIHEKKKRKLLIAQKQARQIQNLKFPKIIQNKVPLSKLEKRFRKTSIKLIESIQSLLPIVLSSEKRISELHELRKDCKKLRYLLELAPNAGSSSFIAKLKQMQDLLGPIHDSDITMNFLKKILPKYDNVSDVLKIESNLRAQLYKKFVETQKDLVKQT